MSFADCSEYAVPRNSFHFNGRKVYQDGKLYGWIEKVLPNRFILKYRGGNMYMKKMKIIIDFSTIGYPH